jgi:monoterpene epsilon-lactone hydrolase
VVSQELAQVRDLLFQFKEASRGVVDIAAARAAYEAAVSAFQPPVEVEITEEELGGVPARRVAAPGSGGALLYLHGGGFCIGSAATHTELAARISLASRVVVHVLDYRLAPEHPFPSALKDAAAAANALYEANGSRPILVAGDSAGGGLAVSLVHYLAAREGGGPAGAGSGFQVGAVICLSPWVDLTLVSPTLAELDPRDPIVSRESLSSMAEMYLSGTDDAHLRELGIERNEELRRHPYVSPVYGSFAGFPPLLLQVGSEEVLLGDAVELERRARAAGASVTLTVYEGCFHVFQQLAASSPEAASAVAEIAEFVRGRAK